MDRGGSWWIVVDRGGSWWIVPDRGGSCLIVPDRAGKIAGRLVEQSDGKRAPWLGDEGETRPNKPIQGGTRFDFFPWPWFEGAFMSGTNQYTEKVPRRIA